MGRYRKDNITLQLRVPSELAISLLGRLYGKGIISREQYLARIKTIDREEAARQEIKEKKFAEILEKSRKFYKNG